MLENGQPVCSGSIKSGLPGSRWWMTVFIPGIRIEISIGKVYIQFFHPGSIVKGAAINSNFNCDGHLTIQASEIAGTGRSLLTCLDDAVQTNYYFVQGSCLHETVL